MIAMLVCSLGAFAEDSPNSQARFFLTFHKYLDAWNGCEGKGKFTGYHPHEFAFAAVNKDKGIYTSTYTHNCRSGSRYVGIKNLNKIIRNDYEKTGAQEIEIVPGIFVKEGNQIVRVKQFEGELDLLVYFEYEPEANIHEIIRRMIAASKVDKWAELLRYGVPLELLAHFGAKSPLSSLDEMERSQVLRMYEDLYK